MVVPVCLTVTNGENGPILTRKEIECEDIIEAALHTVTRAIRLNFRGIKE
jgi:hypothetical protein